MICRSVKRQEKRRPEQIFRGGSMEKILLDTDIGGDIDDAICLAYLLKEPKCDLLGITTVCGESEKRASVADAVCKAAGRSVPIVAGFDRPMQPIPVYPAPDGAAALKNWEHGEFEKGDAPRFLYQKIKDNPGEVTLIATGYMTNVAAMFQKYPDAKAGRHGRDLFCAGCRRQRGNRRNGG